MPYGLIALITCAGLSVWYVTITDAPRRSKYLVGGISLASLMVCWRLPAWRLMAAPLLIATGIYVLLYLKATSDTR
jgi:hypothetical protein